MNRRQVLPALSAVRSARIPYTIHILFGGPGETDELVTQALNLLDEVAPDETIFFAFGLRVFSGTPLERTASREGHIPPGHHMLDPTYYLSPALDESLPERLREPCAVHPHWFSVPYEMQGQGAAS